jgi:arginyl-tRNA synthetase
VLKELLPNRLCEYLYNLSCKATDFLEACFVLNNPARLLLVESTHLMMRACLTLLGITPLERI